MNRIEIILKLVELHNHFVNEWNKKHPNMEIEFWESNLDIDKYYLVESLIRDNSDKENKKFILHIEARKHLTTEEKYSYPKDSKPFYDGYLSTVSFELSYLNDIEAAKLIISKELGTVKKN